MVGVHLCICVCEGSYIVSIPVMAMAYEIMRPLLSAHVLYDMLNTSYYSVVNRPEPLNARVIRSCDRDRLSYDSHSPLYGPPRTILSATI